MYANTVALSDWIPIRWPSCQDVKHCGDKLHGAPECHQEKGLFWHTSPLHWWWFPSQPIRLSSIVRIWPEPKADDIPSNINLWRFKIRSWPVLTTLARICSDCSMNIRGQPDSPQWGWPRPVAGGTQEPEHLWTHGLQRTDWMAGQWPWSSVAPQWKLRVRWSTGHARTHP